MRELSQSWYKPKCKKTPHISHVAHVQDESLGGKSPMKRALSAGEASPRRKASIGRC